MDISDPRRQKLCRVHVYFGSCCKAQVIDTTKKFDDNMSSILENFNLGDRKNDYCLKLTSGGIVERNDVLFQEDKVCILLKGKAVDKYEKEFNLKDVEMALHTENNPEGDGLKYKTPLTKKRGKDLLDENEEDYVPENSTLVEKIDYDSLECILLSKKLTNYKDLLDVVNNEWAKALGFSLKMKRSPKDNSDGSKTLRIYCCKHGGSGRGYCKFAITFKFDEKKEFWLLYQEYNKLQFIHNHSCNEGNENEQNVRSFVSNYSKKVSNISKMNDLIQDTYNAPNDSQVVKIEDPNDEERMADEDMVRLAELLKRKTKEDDILEIIKSDEQSNKVGMLFWSNEEMRNKYLAYRDIVFINRRITKNRFGLPMFLIYVITSDGKNQLVGFCLISKDTQDAYRLLFERFKDYMADKAPKVVLVERQLILLRAIKDVFPKTKVLFDPWHLQRSLQKQFESHDDKFLHEVANLPLEPNVRVLEEGIEKMKTYDFKESYIKSLSEKLINEKELWSVAYQKTFFTGGICVCQRNELLKTHLRLYLLERKYPVSDSFSKLIGLNEKEFKYTEEFSSIDGKFNTVFGKVPLISVFAKNYLSHYAYQKLKFEVAKATKFEIVKKNENQTVEELRTQNSWKIRSMGIPDTEAKIYECVRIPSPLIDLSQMKKGGKTDTIVVCSSFERTNSGLPDTPILTLFLRNIIDFEELVFHKRWFKDYECEYRSKLNENLLSQLCEAETALGEYSVMCSLKGLALQDSKHSKCDDEPTSDRTRDSMKPEYFSKDSIIGALKKTRRTRADLIKSISHSNKLTFEIVEEAKEQGTNKETKKKEVKERRIEDIQFTTKIEIDNSDKAQESDEEMTFDEVKEGMKKQKVTTPVEEKDVEMKDESKPAKLSKESKSSQPSKEIKPPVIKKTIKVEKQKKETKDKQKKEKISSQKSKSDKGSKPVVAKKDPPKLKEEKEEKKPSDIKKKPQLDKKSAAVEKKSPKVEKKSPKVEKKSPKIEKKKEESVSGSSSEEEDDSKSQKESSSDASKSEDEEAIKEPVEKTSTKSQEKSEEESESSEAEGEDTDSSEEEESSEESEGKEKPKEIKKTKEENSQKSIDKNNSQKGACASKVTVEKIEQSEEEDDTSSEESSSSEEEEEEKTSKKRDVKAQEKENEESESSSSQCTDTRDEKSEPKAKASRLKKEVAKPVAKAGVKRKRQATGSKKKYLR